MADFERARNQITETIDRSFPNYEKVAKTLASNKSAWRKAIGFTMIDWKLQDYPVQVVQTIMLGAGEGTQDFPFNGEGAIAGNLSERISRAATLASLNNQEVFLSYEGHIFSVSVYETSRRRYERAIISINPVLEETQTDGQNSFSFQLRRLEARMNRFGLPALPYPFST